MLKIGDSIPQFEVQDSKGNIINNQSIEGKKVIFYFYPKDDTPGCTKEGQDFSGNLKKFEEKRNNRLWSFKMFSKKTRKILYQIFIST